MNEERIGKCLRQMEHIRGHLWHRYSIAVNQVMVATVKVSKWWLQLNEEEPLMRERMMRNVMIGECNDGGMLWCGTSWWGNVMMGKCYDGGMLWWRNVMMGECYDGGMLWWGMLWWRNVMMRDYYDRECYDGGMLWWRNIIMRECCDGEML
jgi:hypothetical protein